MSLDFNVANPSSCDTCSDRRGVPRYGVLQSPIRVSPWYVQGLAYDPVDTPRLQREQVRCATTG